MAKAQTQEVPVATLLDDANAEEITVTPERFVGSGFFAGWDMGTNARRELLGVTAETDGVPVKVRIRPLKRWSLDAPIITELGEFPKALIPLPVWAAIAKTGRSFVGYVQIGETPWALLCVQDGDYRLVEAFSVTFPRVWYDGLLFASLADS